MKFDSLIQMHLQQDYGTFEEPVSVDHLISKYALFPNEAIYLVDCKHAQMEPLTPNFKQITGIDTAHKNELVPLYEHVHRKDLNSFLHFTNALLKYGFGKEQVFKEEQDFITTIYRTHHNRIILKSTAILHVDSNNRSRYSIGKLMDVTGLVQFQSFGYKFIGPGSDQASASMNNLLEFKSILSKREMEVLRYTGMGLRSNDIGIHLNISRHTIDTHKRNILKKLEATSSIEAYNKAKSMGLI